MGKYLYAAPAAEPVTLTEVKSHCRIDHSTDDTLLAGYMLAARHYAETYLRRALITQTWDLLIDYDWPIENVGNGFARRITLPMAPLASVTSVTYVDSAGDTQTLAADQYQVSIKRQEGVIDPAYSVTWPVVRNQIDAITVRFVCGYGASGSGYVPEPIRQAMLLLIGHWYNNREAVIVGVTTSEVPFAVEALLFPYRVFY